MLLLGIAAQQVTRTLAKDRVTEPIRRPVTVGEGQQTPTGTGMQRALGELLTCQYCMAPWVALGLTAAYARFPESTRVASEVLSIAAISDTLNRSYARLQPARRGAGSVIARGSRQGGHMSNAEETREKLVRMLEERAFDPVLRKSADAYQSEADKRKLAAVQRSTDNEKRRYRNDYKTASEVRDNYLSDLHSEVGKRKTSELEQLGLPTLPSIKDDFLSRCQELGVGPS